jgi:hypothetical protein
MRKRAMTSERNNGKQGAGFMPKNALQGNGLILTQGAMNSTMYNQNNASGNGS